MTPAEKAKALADAFAAHEGSVEDFVKVDGKASPNEGNPDPESSWATQLVGQMGSSLMRTVGGSSFALAAEQAEGKDIGTVGRTAMGVGKGLTMGGAGVIAGVAETFEDAAQGQKTSFGQNIADNREVYDEQSNLGGELIGGLLPGAVAAKAAMTGAKAAAPTMFEYLNKMLLGRVAIGATAAGAESAFYAAAEGKDWDEVKDAAKWGAILGGGFVALSDTGIKLAQGLGSNVKRNAAKELVEALKLANGEADGLIRQGPDGVALLNEGPIRGRAARFGPDATLYDAVPTHLHAQVDSLLSTDKRSFSNVLPLYRFVQNRAMSANKTFSEGIDAAIQSDAVRSTMEVISNGAAARQALQPQYDDVLQQALNDGVSYKASTLHKMVDDIFHGTDLPQNTQLVKHLKAMIGPTSVPGKGANANKRFARSLSPRDAMELKWQLDKAVYGKGLPRVDKFEQINSVDKSIVTQRLQPLRQLLAGSIDTTIPDIVPLNAKYADEILVGNAYDTGRKLFSNKRVTGDDFDIFMMDPNKNPTQVSAFVEGVKAEIGDMLSNKDTAASIKRYLAPDSPQMEKLRAVLTPKQVDEIAASVERYSASASTAKLAAKTPPASFDHNANILQRGVDLMTGGGALAGVTSKAAGLGAGRRMLNAVTPPGIGALAAAQSEMLIKPALQGAKAVNNSILDSLPDILKNLNLGAVSAGAVAGKDLAE